MIFFDFFFYYIVLYADSYKAKYIFSKPANSYVYFDDLTKNHYASFSETPITKFKLKKNSEYEGSKTILSSLKAGEMALTYEKARENTLSLSEPSSDIDQVVYIVYSQQFDGAEIKINDKCLTSGAIEPYFSQCEKTKFQIWSILDKDHISKTDNKVKDGDFL